MPPDYFLDRSGRTTERMQGLAGEGHMTPKGIEPQNEADLYSQMFRLKFARIVEHDDGQVGVEHTCKLTAKQERFLQALADAGKTIVYISVRRGSVRSARG